jgi:hypothetical protein
VTDDALAAVIAAARLLLEQSAVEPARPPVPAWHVAGRLSLVDAAGAQIAARARSRWAVSERLRG